MERFLRECKTGREAKREREREIERWREIGAFIGPTEYPATDRIASKYI